MNLMKILKNYPSFKYYLELSLKVNESELENRSYKYPYDSYGLKISSKNKAKIELHEVFYYTKNEIQNLLTETSLINVENLGNKDYIFKTYGIKDKNIVCNLYDYDISHSNNLISLSFEIEKENKYD